MYIYIYIYILYIHIHNISYGMSMIIDDYGWKLRRWGRYGQMGMG